MKSRHLVFSLLSILFLTGCSTFTDAELGQIRQRGVSPRVVNKLEDGRVLAPQDVIELTRRHVPDNLIIRQIEDAGVDYVLGKDDFKRLREAGVSAAVFDALIYASDEFARGYAAPSYVTSYDVYPDYPYGYYYDRPRAYYPRYGGSVGVQFSSPVHRHWNRRH